MEGCEVEGEVELVKRWVDWGLYGGDYLSVKWAFYFGLGGLFWIGYKRVEGFVGLS